MNIINLFINFIINLFIVIDFIVKINLLLLLLIVILELFARHNKEFVSSVSSGQECGLLLDKTALYAEQVGDWTSGYLDL